MLSKVNLAAAFARFSDPWSSKIAADIGDFQLKLTKLSGAFEWHHHAHEDELFLVTHGRLRIGFRDQPPVDLDAGEFIVVPRGEEHLPEALSDECHVVLLEPNSTLNTGTVETARTVRVLERIDER